MEAMVALEKRGYRVDAPDLGRSYRALKDTQKKIAAVKKKLEKATTDSDRETAESQIRSLEVEENQIKHKYETAKSLFENSSDEIDSILEKDRNFEKISYGSTIDEDNYVEKIKGVGLKIRRIQGLLEDLGDAFKGREQYYRKLYSDRYNSGKEFQTLGELSNAILEMDRKEATLEKLGDSFDRILRSELKKNAGSYSIEESLSTAAQIVKYLAHFSKEKSNRYAEWCKLLIEAADDQNTLTTAGQALGPALSRGDSKSYQEVVQLFRNRLSETIRRKLMGAPQSSLSSLLQRLRDLRQSYKEVTRYLDKSLNAGETLLDPELLTSISEELSKNAESLGIRGVTLEQMKSLVLSSFPELGPSPLNWKSLQGILADLRSLGDNKSLTRQESSLVDVKLLEELVIYDRWRWQEHAETSESASPEYAVKEAIQEQDLVFRTKHRLRSTQARRTLDRVEKSRQEAFYQTFVATRKIQVPNKEEYFLDSELTKILIRRLSKDRPEDLSTLKALIQENSILSEKEFNQFLSQYFRRLLKKYPSVDEATFQFWKNLDEAGFAPGHQQMYGLSEAIESWIPSGKIRAGIPDLGFYNAYRKGVRKFAEHIREHGAKARYENSLDIERAGEIEFEIGRRLGSNKIVNLFETDRYRFHSPDAIAETFLESLRDDPKFFPRARWDQVFDYLLSFRDSHPKIRERLLDPALVSKVFFVTTKERLAKWQLSNIRGFNEFLDDYKAKRAPLPKEGEVRPIVREVYKLIAKQFPDRSPSGVGVLQYVEKQLLPNEAETHLLADLRINASNWSKTRGIEYADAPQALAGMITSDPERLKLIKFFIGVTDEPPSIAGIYPDRLLFGRRSFQENGPVFRALTLQSLLDTQTGFLESPESRKELKKVIFGSAIEDPAIMTIFEAYLDVLPKSEKKVFVSAILASYGQDRPGRVSLKRVLEAGGPLGGKASQDLVTNAVVDEAGRADLMESFDNVLPPIREEVIGQLKEAFGKNYVMIKGIGRVPGSGSLNYVVEAVIFNPKSKRKETVSVRIQKKNVSNLIEGENSAWVKVWGKLRDHPNPKVRRLMRIIEDRRAAAYKTLNPNGSQLDLKMERDAYELAKRAYQNSDPDPKTGFTVEPVEPKLRLQKLVDKDHQTRVSVYEFVEHTKLADIPDPELRRALAAQIMEAELRAIEHRGVFDEDGHIGNWLIDLKKKRLVRVDYAQLHQIKPEQVQSFKTVLGSLMDASAGAQERLEPLILSQFSHIFETSETPPDLEAVLRSVLREPELQQTLSPFEKLLRIQDRVETHYLDHGIKDLRVTLKEEFRAPLASLVRASMFRESTGNLAYLRRLSTFFGVDANAIAKAHISREVADFVSESRTRATQAAIRTGLSLLDRGRSLGVRSATSLRCGLNGALKRLSTPKGGGSQPDDESK